MPILICDTQLLAFTSRLHVVQGQLRNELSEVRIAETTMERCFDLVYRADRYLPPVAERLANIIRNYGDVLFVRHSENPIATANHEGHA